VALGSYCLILPSLNARRFVRAVNAGDFATADTCFVDENDRFLESHNREYWTFKLGANLEPWSLSEFFHGERHISYTLNFGGPRPLIHRGGTIVASFRGLGSFDHTSGGFGGFSM
jgi:hypothetical protein